MKPFIPNGSRFRSFLEVERSRQNDRQNAMKGCPRRLRLVRRGKGRAYTTGKTKLWQREWERPGPRAPWQSAMQGPIDEWTRGAGAAGAKSTLAISHARAHRRMDSGSRQSLTAVSLKCTCSLRAALYMSSHQYPSTIRSCRRMSIRRLKDLSFIRHGLRGREVQVPNRFTQEVFRMQVRGRRRSELVADG